MKTFATSVVVCRLRTDADIVETFRDDGTSSIVPERIRFAEPFARRSPNGLAKKSVMQASSLRLEIPAKEKLRREHKLHVREKNSVQ